MQITADNVMVLGRQPGHEERAAELGHRVLGDRGAHRSATYKKTS